MTQKLRGSECRISFTTDWSDDSGPITTLRTLVSSPAKLRLDVTQRKNFANLKCNINTYQRQPCFVSWKALAVVMGAQHRSSWLALDLENEACPPSRYLWKASLLKKQPWVTKSHSWATIVGQSTGLDWLVISFDHSCTPWERHSYSVTFKYKQWQGDSSVLQNPQMVGFIEDAIWVYTEGEWQKRMGTIGRTP